MITTDGTWRQEAVCRPGNGTDATIFFAADPEPAKKICATCTVADECLAEAFESERETATRLLRQCGVYGGLTGVERATIRRAVA